MREIIHDAVEAELKSIKKLAPVFTGAVFTAMQVPCSSALFNPPRTSFTELAQRPTLHNPAYHREYGSTERPRYNLWKRSLHGSL